jgi:hypothetical protein
MNVLDEPKNKRSTMRRRIVITNKVNHWKYVSSVA